MRKGAIGKNRRVPLGRDREVQREREKTTSGGGGMW